MYYTIYKTTNKIDGKYYIGKHQTKDLNDGYLGSGKLLKRAIEKHGIENFTKEILHVFDNEQNMNKKEAELVVVSEETYNLCPGGHGGFGYINENKLSRNSHIFSKEDGEKGRETSKKRKTSIAWDSSIRGRWSLEVSKKGNLASKTPQAIKKRKRIYKEIGHQQGPKNSQYGKPRSPETRKKISEALRKRNS